MITLIEHNFAPEKNKRKKTDYGSLFSCINSRCALRSVPALLPYAEGQALAEGERNALTKDHGDRFLNKFFLSKKPTLLHAQLIHNSLCV